MSKPSYNVNSDTGHEDIFFNLLSAAKRGDIIEGRNAIISDPDSIYEINHLGMNALQISMVNFHMEFGLFLIKNTKISTTHKDNMGRDSMDIALVCSNNKLGDAIWERWNEEMTELEERQENKVTSLKPKGP